MFKKKFDKRLEKTYPELERYNLNELFYKATDYLEEAANICSAGLIGLLELDFDKFEMLKDKIHEVESNSDDVHDYIVQRLYGQEALVFSRADRLFIVSELDDFVDHAQEILFNASIYRVASIPNTIIIRLVNQIDSFKQVGLLLKEAIRTLFKNFNATIPIIREVEKIKSIAHREHLMFLQRLFELDLDAKEFVYFERLENSIWHSIYMANKFGDGLRRLIFKYRI